MILSCDYCGIEFERDDNRDFSRRYCSRECKKKDDAIRTDTLRTKHGKYSSGAYKSYYAMLQRCNNPNSSSYGSYGGRGIRVCESWNDSFEKFLKDMGIDQTVTLLIEST